MTHGISKYARPHGRGRIRPRPRKKRRIIIYEIVIKRQTVSTVDFGIIMGGVAIFFVALRFVLQIFFT